MVALFPARAGKRRHAKLKSPCIYIYIYIASPLMGEKEEGRGALRGCWDVT